MFRDDCDDRPTSFLALMLFCHTIASINQRSKHILYVLLFCLVLNHTLNVALQTFSCYFNRMVAIFIKAAASLATGVLAFSSARNIAETISIMSSQEDQTAEVVDKSPLLQKYISSDKKIGSSISLLVPNDKTSDDIVQDLKQMKRKELLTLFLLCEAPTATAEKDVLLGSWDGTLLNNNSVLVSRKCMYE